MELHGHRGSNPKVVLASLLNKREKLQEELRNVEKQVYELETSYLQESGTFGNALKGFEGFLSTSNKNSNLKRSRKFQLEDRLFSLSSVTSPAAEELGLGREDGRPDPTQGRMRGGGFANNGQGKPKKGRTGPRDGKKFRISNDMDLDDEDDPDSILR
ncbi:chromatin modification-related protein MEAF6-like [Solanum tuberosum]|uniref:Chromatin modification-related protein MEAF6 n=1 Tax=Solanum tuberosum TaxID=4113 RepID=M1BG30_SOLTU|nr:PREDICTED: chromatin modification-related protein MEAF6-like [Solanum tuberosum]